MAEAERSANKPFGFTDRWFELGLVTEEVLAELQTEWDKGEDDNAEHYRYWAFKRFLAEHRPLSPELAIALWELAEADRELQWVIRTDLVHLPECPQSLLDAALASGLKHLARIIERRKA